MRIRARQALRERIHTFVVLCGRKLETHESVGEMERGDRKELRDEEGDRYTREREL